jgi:transposase
MLTQRTGQNLENWLSAAEADDQPELHSFAIGIRRDQRAITARLTLPHSSGKVEGNVNRLNEIKRQMHGRAKLDLLRKNRHLRLAPTNLTLGDAFTKLAPEPNYESENPSDLRNFKR